ncbi:Bestrophin-3 [Armadillidium vulgare]|nr:Bestrophin-3 [Armadillidium vulgare]
MLHVIGKIEILQIVCLIFLQEILSRAVSKEVHTSQSTSSPSSEMKPELMTQKERKEKSEKPDLNENHFCSADNEIVNEERRKSEAASESSDYGSSSKCTSSEYFPVYDRPSNYLQVQFSVKRNGNSKQKFKIEFPKKRKKKIYRLVKMVLKKMNRKRGRRSPKMMMLQQSFGFKNLIIENMKGFL